MKTKHIFLLGMIMMFSGPHLFSQGFDGKTRWVVGLGMQQQDRRLYDWPSGSAEDILRNSTRMPNWNLSVGISKPILYRQDFSLDFGMGYVLESNSFSRPYNPAPLLKDPPFINTRVVLLGGYFIHSGTATLALSYQIIRFMNGGLLFFSCDAMGSLHWLKWMREKTPTFRLFNPSQQNRITIAPYSVEINPGLGFENGGFRITMNYRVWQKKQVDPVLFVPGLYHTLSSDPYETYNPFKMWITVSRDLEEGWWKGRGKR